MKLILASSSPRRAEVLRNAGFVFQVRPADVDETRLPHEAAQDYVRRVAQAKAHDDRRQARAAAEHAIVIAADTTVLAEAKFSKSRKTPKSSPHAAAIQRQNA